jgi:hypothetical protein
MSTLDTSAVETREISRLIASDKVEGTPVYNKSDEKIGTIKRPMIDKLSGKVAYAVMCSAASSASARNIIRCHGAC